MNPLRFRHALLLGSLLTLPLGLAAQQAGHDHHGHGDHGGQQTPPQMDHGGHGGHQGHAGHDAHAGHDMGPRVTRGSWSYLDRDNPEPHDRDRWVMVPMPGIQAGYRFVRTVDEADVCAALDERRIMVDRATREACAARPAAMPFRAVAISAGTDAHGDHGGHVGGQGHGAPMEHGMDHGDHNTHDGHGSHQTHGERGAPESHEPQGDHGDHGGHGGHGGHGNGGHSWAAPPEAVAMANPVPATRESIRRGESAYQAYCMVCHGAKARGDGPAANGLPTRPTDLPSHLPHHTDGEFAWRIRTGNGVMPAFEDVLTDRQIWDVVNYLRALDPSNRGSG
jgi:mono/diheme cytochrome c family protein